MKFKFLAVILIMLFVIPGCAPKPLTCPANELQAAFLLYPPKKGRGISLTPTLSWEYPTSPSGCSPKSIASCSAPGHSSRTTWAAIRPARSPRGLLPHPCNRGRSICGVSGQWSATLPDPNPLPPSAFS